MTAVRVMVVVSAMAGAVYTRLKPPPNGARFMSTLAEAVAKRPL